MKKRLKKKDQLRSSKREEKTKLNKLTEMRRKMNQENHFLIQAKKKREKKLNKEVNFEIEAETN